MLPGPGWLLIFVGLGILSTEYMWARRLLDTAKRKAEQAKNAVIKRKANRAQRKTQAERRDHDRAHRRRRLTASVTR